MHRQNAQISGKTDASGGSFWAKMKAAVDFADAKMCIGPTLALRN
jgi:hypothetical protein